MKIPDAGNGRMYADPSQARIGADGLSLGCAQLGNLHREVSDEQARATLDATWNLGVHRASEKLVREDAPVPA